MKILLIIEVMESLSVFIYLVLKIIFELYHLFGVICNFFCCFIFFVIFLIEDYCFFILSEFISNPSLVLYRIFLCLVGDKLVFECWVNYYYYFFVADIWTDVFFWKEMINSFNLWPRDLRFFIFFYCFLIILFLIQKLFQIILKNNFKWVWLYILQIKDKNWFLKGFFVNLYRYLSYDLPIRLLPFSITKLSYNLVKVEEIIGTPLEVDASAAIGGPFKGRGKIKGDGFVNPYSLCQKYAYFLSNMELHSYYGSDRYFLWKTMFYTKFFFGTQIHRPYFVSSKKQLRSVFRRDVYEDIGFFERIKASLWYFKVLKKWPFRSKEFIRFYFYQDIIPKKMQPIRVAFYKNIKFYLHSGYKRYFKQKVLLSLLKVLLIKVNWNYRLFTVDTIQHYILLVSYRFFKRFYK